MTEATKATRLSKAAREFNVGIHTIVEYLAKKGIEVEAKPTSKLSPEAYELLLAEFMDEKAVKEESKKMELDNSLHESITLDDINKTSDKEEVEPEADIMIELLDIYKDEKIFGCIKIRTFAFLPEKIAPRKTIYIIYSDTGPSLFLQCHEIRAGRAIPFP